SRQAISRSAKVDSHSLDPLALLRIGAILVMRPEFELRHVDESERGLVLVGTSAGPRIVWCVEDPVGRDEVGAAAGFESAKIARAAVCFQIVVARRTR